MMSRQKKRLCCDSVYAPPTATSFCCNEGAAVLVDFTNLDCIGLWPRNLRPKLTDKSSQNKNDWKMQLDITFLVLRQLIYQISKRENCRSLRERERERAF